MEVDKIAFHLDLKPEQVKSGLHYYEAYPEEIDLALEENNLGYKSLKSILPNLDLATILTDQEHKVNG